MSRTRRAAWYTATQLLFTAITFAVGLAVTPLVVHWLGDARFGACRVVLEYYGYLSLLELGLGGALAPLLARAVGTGDRAGLRGALAAGVRVYCGVALATAAVVLVLAPGITWLVPVSPADAADLRRGWLVGLFSFLLLLLSPFRALAEASQRGYFVNLLMTAQAVIMAAASVALARAGWGITGQVVALVLGNATVMLALAWDGARRYPGVLGAGLLTRPDPRVWRDLWSLSPPTLLLNLCARVGLLTDYIIVGKVLRGTGPVTTLFLTQRLAVVAQNQLQGVGNAAWAGLAELHARGQRETFLRRLVELTGLLAVLGVAALGPIVAYNRRFFELWVPREAYGGDAVILVASANTLLLALFTLWTWCFIGTGQVRRVVPLAAAMAAINLAASVSLTWWLGLIGPLLGTLVSFVAVYLWGLPLLLRRTFGAPVRELAAALARPLACGVPYVLALRWLAHVHTPPWGWAGLIAEMGAAALAFLALAWRVLLSPTDRDRWRLRLALILPRIRRPEGERTAA
jgi:O-antigen/teichoic acid export membrane protein